MTTQGSSVTPSRLSSFGRMVRHVSFCALDPASMGRSYKYRERFNNAVFISPKREFLFTKCEKCANVTMRRSLQNLVAERPLPPSFDDTDRWFAPLLQPSDLGLWRIDQINDIPFKFAVVRNPYSRLLSFYLNVRRESYSKALRGSTDMDFETFVDLVTSQTVEEMDPHWRVQYHNIFCDVIRYDHFARFENLEAELQTIMARYAPQTSEIRSVHKNQSNAGTKIATYYTAAIGKKVREKYAIDFEFFGYPLELPG
ncbi:MAG: sulfotransferase family 2 domain-containing protein [Methyloceanibacter sp.]